MEVGSCGSIEIDDLCPTEARGQTELGAYNARVLRFGISVFASVFECSRVL
jgi:hypothetical protein